MLRAIAALALAAAMMAALAGCTGTPGDKGDATEAEGTTTTATAGPSTTTEGATTGDPTTEGTTDEKIVLSGKYYIDQMDEGSDYSEYYYEFTCDTHIVGFANGEIASYGSYEIHENKLIVGPARTLVLYDFSHFILSEDRNSFYGNSEGDETYTFIKLTMGHDEPIETTVEGATDEKIVLSGKYYIDQMEEGSVYSEYYYEFTCDTHIMGFADGEMVWFGIYEIHGDELTTGIPGISVHGHANRKFILSEDRNSYSITENNETRIFTKRQFNATIKKH